MKENMNKNQILLNFINNEVTTLPTTVNNKIRKNKEKFQYRNEYYELIKYINDFLEGEDLNRYIILPGLRGVGKTTILYQIYEYLLKEKNIDQNQILYISCENLNDRFEFKILDVIESFLNTYHNSNLRTLDKKIFLLIDESQYDYNWALSGKIIYDSTDNIFMIFTGSSALNLEYNADSARRLLKRNINPLNYNQYLSLKYNFNTKNISKDLYELLFMGNIENAVESEKEINSRIVNIKGYTNDDWINFLRYGGFLISLHEKYYRNTSERLTSIVKKIITNDMNNISNISSDTQIIAMRLLNFLALQQPGEVSQNNIANYLDVSSTTVNKLLDILEKTHLLFHNEPFGSASKRIKKSWKYYFATSSLRHALCQDLGNTMRDFDAYHGVLLENFVASTFFNLIKMKKFSFNFFYDVNKKKNVDFLIQQGFDKPIPIEVSFGIKDKKQIKNAINRFNSDYGIIISNTTSSIEKEDNVIFLPYKTFSLI